MPRKSKSKKRRKTCFDLKLKPGSIIINKKTNKMVSIIFVSSSALFCGPLNARDNLVYNLNRYKGEFGYLEEAEYRAEWRKLSVFEKLLYCKPESKGSNPRPQGGKARR